MNSFQWKWPEENEELNRQAREIAEILKIPAALGRILSHRGIGVNEAYLLENRTLAKCTAAIGEPEGTREAAVFLLHRARTERIGILCDYDVDGATAHAIVIQALRAILPSDASVPLVVVPDRHKEGYGPNERCLNELISNKVSFVVVMDCGTDKAELLNRFHVEHGLIPLVVDHHPPHDVQPPTAGMIINPYVHRKPDPGEQGSLCTAALAWFLARALLREAGLTAQETVLVRKQITVLAALGTSCDMMPLNQPFNRALLRTGLRFMHEPEALSVGLAALCQAAKLKGKYSYSDLGFRIGPRINAGSRIDESGLAAKCLREQDQDKAVKIAEKLNTLNASRMSLQRDAINELDQTTDQSLLAAGPVNIYFSEKARPGIVGLVASSLQQSFGWPAIVLARKEDGSLAGSGRSALGFNIGGPVSAAFQKGILLTGGGHAMACGMTLQPDQLDTFKEFMLAKFQEHADQSEEPVVPTLRIEAVMERESLEQGALLSIAEGQVYLEPWGPGFPGPLFGIRECSVEKITNRKGHLFMDLNSGGKRFQAVLWRASGFWKEHFGVPDPENPMINPPPVNRNYELKVDVAGSVKINKFNNISLGQFNIRLLRESSSE